MEPLRIKLQNFTSYADAELDLTGIELAALMGPNGAGKSSIPDALLWALFGEATKGGTKALDNYVRRGETECRVEVDFRLHDQKYRVIRHRSAGKGKTLLEFYWWDQLESVFAPLSGKTVTETQEKIEQVLRLDYRTFTASSMILQGQSASLTADMTDAERKEVLARILGLDVWDKIQEAAREKGRDARVRVKVLNDQVAQVAARAGRRPEVEEAIADRTRALGEADLAIRQSTNVVNDLEAEYRQRPTLEQQERDLKVQIGARQGDIQQVNRDSAQLQLDLKEQECLIGRPAVIGAEISRVEVEMAEAIDRRQALDEQVEALDVQVRGADGIIERVADIDRQITARSSDLEQITQDGLKVRQQLDQHQILIARASQIRTAAATADDYASEITRLDGLAERCAALDRQGRELEAEVIAWDREHDSEVLRLETELHSAHRQGHALSQTPCGEDLRNVCPLLAGAREAVENEQRLAGRLSELRPQQNPHAEAWMALVNERAGLGYDPAAHAAARKGLTDVQQDARLLPVLESTEQQAAELSRQREALKSRYTAVEQELAGLRTDRERWQQTVVMAEQQRTDLARLRIELEAARHAETHLRDRMARLQQSLQEAQGAETGAIRRIEQLTGRSAELEQRLGSLQQDVQALQERLAGVQRKLAGFVELERRLADARVVLDADRQTEAAIREALGRLRQDLTEVERAESELEQIRVDLATAVRESQVYEILDQAAGKKSGVPALIVENAVPQIEHIANDLLARMAGGRLAIRLDTQAEGKSTGTLQEVLRITVLDGGVDRPYQTYSGAERFMVDLALRVALSRFLAHRAGAEIQFMVLDEGLGALDASNRPQVMAALNEAAREFRKVLVITHIAELQDALPQRIEVSRGPSGSEIRVVA